MPITQDQLVALADNPERGIDILITDVESNWFNKRVQINSKAHPAILAYDLILGTTHGLLNRVDDAISKTFADHARNISELAKHMGDEEKIGLFGNPSSCVLLLGIQIDAFTKLAKEETVTVGKVTNKYRVLLFPKDTEIIFNGVYFAIENGIEIRFRDSSGYQVVYDEKVPNPQAPIRQNILQRDFKVENGNNFLTIQVPVRQLQCTPTEGLTSNASSGCRGTINYFDNLYNVRAFIQRPNSNVKQEIKVVFDQDVFDQNNITLALNIDTTNKTFNYEIPDVYIQDGSGVGTISIYTYTTLGELVKDYRSVPLKEVKVNYQDYRYGAGRLGEYSEGIRNSGAIAWAAMTPTSGGTNPRPFLEVKESFLLGRRTRTLPITNNNLEGTVEASGYNSVKVIDYLTGRQYSITKELPVQKNKSFYSAMSCFVGSHLASANQLVNSGVVLDNGKRVTIPHNVLFDVTDYTTQLVTGVIRDRYLGLSNEELVELIANRTLVYTPFYYVMDLTNNQAVLRTYHLDAPKVNFQTFVSENEALGIEVGVNSISVEHQDDGYLITVVTQSSQSYKQLENDSVGIQMSMNITDSVSLASVRGTFYGVNENEERIWQFKLSTNFDIDVNDVIYFNNLWMFGQPQYSVGTPLELTMSFIFTMDGDPATTDTPSDRRIEQAMFDDLQLAIIETSYSVTLGSRMNNLYSRIRPLVGEGQYKRYETDIPQLHETDVLKRDPVTGNLVFDAQGKVIILHRAGDPEFTSDGKPIYKYLKNNIVMDENGKPVPLGPRDLLYHFDFIGFDGAYYFSRDAYDKEYAQETKDHFTEVINADMKYFDTLMLDRTGLFYQPRSKIGSQEVIVNSNYQMSLKQDLSFVLVWYLSETGYKNQNLKESLLEASPRLINEALVGSTRISTAELSNILLKDAPEEVRGLKVSALAGDSSIDIISNEDALTGFGIRKVLRLTSDQLISVQEAVDVTFMPHDVNMVNMGN